MKLFTIIEIHQLFILRYCNIIQYNIKTRQESSLQIMTPTEIQVSHYINCVNAILLKHLHKMTNIIFQNSSDLKIKIREEITTKTEFNEIHWL